MALLLPAEACGLKTCSLESSARINTVTVSAFRLSFFVLAKSRYDKGLLARLTPVSIPFGPGLNKSRT